jgi:transposase
LSGSYRIVEVNDMTDEIATAPLADPFYDGRKSGSAARAGRGVEVRVREVRRRNWSSEERLRIVRETLEPGVIVQAVADRHSVSTGQLYTWRKQMLAPAMSGFVPVEVVPEIARLETPAPPTAPAPLDAPGAIKISLPSGVSIRITGSVDAAVLRVVLTKLGGG